MESNKQESAPTRGKLIVIEGPKYSGKEDLAAFLSLALNSYSSLGVASHLFSSPRNPKYKDLIIKLSSHIAEHLNILMLDLLRAADDIELLLKKGEWVIVSTWIPFFMTHQALANQEFCSSLFDFLIKRLPTPDFKYRVSCSFSLCKKNFKKNRRMENILNQQLVHAAYNTYEKGWTLLYAEKGDYANIERILLDTLPDLPRDKRESILLSLKPTLDMFPSKTQQEKKEELDSTQDLNVLIEEALVETDDDDAKKKEKENSKKEKEKQKKKRKRNSKTKTKTKKAPSAVIELAELSD